MVSCAEENKRDAARTEEVKNHVKQSQVMQKVCSPGFISACMTACEQGDPFNEPYSIVHANGAAIYMNTPCQPLNISVIEGANT
jgi:hypothetical protein